MASARHQFILTLLQIRRGGEGGGAVGGGVLLSN